MICLFITLCCTFKKYIQMAIYKQFKTFSSSICFVIMAVIKVALVGIIHNLAGIFEVTQQSLSSVKQICMKLISLGKEF